jgi:hypothetical protein
MYFSLLLLLYFCTFLYSPFTSSPLSDPIVEHPRPEAFLYSETPSFTPIQINRQYYSSLYLNVYSFVSKGKERLKTLDQIVGEILELDVVFVSAQQNSK